MMQLPNARTTLISMFPGMENHENGVLLTRRLVLREKVTGERRELHNEKLQNLYLSPHIVRIIRSWTMKWVGYVVCIGEMRNKKCSDRRI
jgi:hypothetical protein